MDRLCEILRQRVLDHMDFSREMGKEELQELIAGELARAKEKECLTLVQRVQVEQRVFNSLRKLDVLQELVEDESVTEILVNGPEHIFYEKNGTFLKYPYHFASEEKLQDVVQQIVGRHNRSVNLANPIVDSRLEDGSRVNVVLSPIALDGTAVSIRKFSKSPLHMEALIERGTITQEAADFLKKLVENRYNLFISGGTGSGKTTFLNALSAYIPENERIITIEDSAELQLQQVPNLVRLETRTVTTEGVKAITARDLIHTALRMRPDRIIVGECRGAEALDMLQAMNTGHDGSLSTGHGNSTGDMIGRLETMVCMGCDLPIATIRQQITSGLEILIHLERGKNGARKVVEITELTGIKKGEIQFNKLFQGREQLVKVGELIRREKLREEGYE